ncbi:MAG: response regulator [Anaerolineales bacterium]|nr:response regulator [Anaerolineales bacterium]
MDTVKILVVEDDRDNLGLIRFILERSGYTVLEAYDGREGLEIARRELPDLVIMDLAMPEMDGWTASRLIKEDPATQKIKIMVVSVRSLLEDRRRALEAGCDAFVTKPMSVANLTAQVAKLLKKNED